MNRYMHCDFYPEFHVNFIKKGSVNDVPPVTLKDMGFTDDVDYRDQPLEELPKDRKEAIISEFIFLIDKVLPRDIQDLFYRIALDPRPAYWEAFEKAADRMQLEKYDDHTYGNKKGQFINHVQLGIQDLVEEGLTLQEIYDTTCVTKDMLNRTAREGFPRDYYSKCRARWDAMELESIVFGIKGASYKVQVPVGDSAADICVYDGDIIALAIKMVVDGVYLPEDHRSEGYPYDEVEKLISYCKTESIPLFLVDYSELDDNEFDFGLSKRIKQAIGDVEFCNKHNEDRRVYIREDWAIYDDEDIKDEVNADSYIINEPVFEPFSGQTKGIKLVSNRLCFGPQPRPKDEIEQHLSLYSDGRVFFSGYVFGLGDDIKYQRNRSKQFKISELEMTYLLSHVAMYFSKDFSLDIVMDVGYWTLEIINTEGKSFKYEGALFSDLMLDDVGLSSLIRKYLGMSDLLGFDGDARLPIIKEDDEYIFVNVFFEGGGKTYCYLCDDDLIQDGDEVLVPVGRDEELKSVIVDSVELHTAEDAPFPIDKCKKVVRRV